MVYAYTCYTYVDSIKTRRVINNSYSITISHDVSIKALLSCFEKITITQRYLSQTLWTTCI